MLARAAEAVRYLERNIILNAVDRLWQEHLYATDSLREAVYLRAYGQKDPLVEYKTEAYDMFTELMANIKGEILHNLFRSTSNLEAFGAFLQNLPQFLIRADETGNQTTEASGGPAIGDSAQGGRTASRSGARPIDRRGARLPTPAQFATPRKWAATTRAPAAAARNTRTAAGAWRKWPGALGTTCENEGSGP